MSNFFTLTKVPRTITASLHKLRYTRKYLKRTSTRAFTIINTFNMPEYSGSCYCKGIKYTVTLDSKDQARTSICHCGNCRKWTGSAFGITTKIPKSALRVEGKTVEHVSDNGSGTKLYREFCGTCGGGILEYGANAGENTYITYGSLDKPEELPPKGEFFCKYRQNWMPQVPNTFQKREIKE
ncbi:Similar to Uncharacterized lyase C29B12.13; acc. no. O14034 [Pyronema omphalodes CBS 100304]|uniref:Similar to Uncharacterized lyase C29B12.13 acc. no. O14034 n=1 Tax=Pyronema omphalodes (strain CBS 100304) TaxID=1076935 RepID=U4L8E7_PYROM|nr:Similar to Uncharacterized lyase C29B12.13; acc. no. O14034 [Pyronema omphalodes CBS 100304]